MKVGVSLRIDTGVILISYVNNKSLPDSRRSEGVSGFRRFEDNWVLNCHDISSVRLQVEISYALHISTTDLLKLVWNEGHVTVPPIEKSNAEDDRNLAR